MGKRPSLAVLSGIVLIAGGCAGHRTGDLTPVAASAQGASPVEVLVATTRADAAEPPAGVMFSGQRGSALRFADIVVSIPPESQRKTGEIQWPSSSPGDPAHDFVTLRADKLELKPAIAYFDQRVAGARDAHVLVFVHGYNTNFEEAVYGFAQFVHDSNTPELVPVLFTWPSRGRLFDYAYDRESALYSRDALEVVLNAMAKNSKVKSISIVAHSMGNFLTVETLRQMAIRDRVLSPKIKDIVLASPDIDVDVFRRQIEQIEASDKAPPITLLVSQDDRALTFSRFIAGDAARLGAIDPTAERFRSILEKAHVQVIDLTKFDSNDPTNHRKFATSEFVKVIGRRLASGQTLADSKITLGQAVVGAATKITSTVATAVAAPVSLFDPSATAPPDVQASSLLQ